MFIYVGSPYSEIIGYSIIIDIKPMTFIEGIRLLDKARITKPELEKYFHGYSSVGGYRVSKITLFDSPVSPQTLRGESGFSPPHRALFFYQSAHRSGSTSNLMPAKGRIAVKVINHLGDEVMKVFRVG
jgi:predicted transcriptional regulator